MRFTLFLSLCLALSMIFTPVISFSPENEEKPSANVSSEKVKKEEKITILRTETNEKITLTMTDYLTGVVSAEMSPLFSEEALKAQAIAAHTYALYQTNKGITLTDNYKKHQGYISPEEAQKKWGDNYEIYSKKITSCVEEVKDRIITYEGEIILPAYFALCSGKTENSEDVWGGKVPYLVSVTSEGDRLSPDLVSEKAVSREEFESFAGFSLDETPVFSLDCTEAGAVKKLTVNGSTFTGNEVQKAFNLKSNNFSLTYSENTFLFTVTGNGHGVGMSQYGADFMARQGASAEEILKHYYSGVKIEQM